MHLTPEIADKKKAGQNCVGPAFSVVDLVRSVLRGDPDAEIAAAVALASPQSDCSIVVPRLNLDLGAPRRR